MRKLVTLVSTRPFASAATRPVRNTFNSNDLAGVDA